MLAWTVFPTLAYTPTANLNGWVTHAQDVGGITGITEVSLTDNGAADATEAAFLISECADIIGNGSGKGRCNCPTQPDGTLSVAALAVQSLRREDCPQGRLHIPCGPIFRGIGSKPTTGFGLCGGFRTRGKDSSGMLTLCPDFPAKRPELGGCLSGAGRKRSKPNRQTVGICDGQ